jgi:hypothetical protein
MRDPSQLRDTKIDAFEAKILAAFMIPIQLTVLEFKKSW